jgi:hypothetical protein
MTVCDKHNPGKVAVDKFVTCVLSSRIPEMNVTSKRAIRDGIYSLINSGRMHTALHFRVRNFSSYFQKVILIVHRSIILYIFG